MSPLETKIELHINVLQKAVSNKQSMLIYSRVRGVWKLHRSGTDLILRKKLTKEANIELYGAWKSHNYPSVTRTRTVWDLSRENEPGQGPLSHEP